MAVGVQPFWTERTAAWFPEVEAQVFLAGTSNVRIKCYYVPLSGPPVRLTRPTEVHSEVRNTVHYIRITLDPPVT